ncbi:hypothetical protein FSP39_001009 [Pinctada imbricata]|uniref:Major facilitator superfamily (MFS) profile domain-containing protein n=1 Tax=Pinctada imbricata TaxID=66713 RepID=A0AA88YRU7_PINIB|nr:hypothetical protein FSP39_001009 [Pinctada imbricata]
MGIAKSFGIIYAELLVYFGASKSDTSWIASIGSGLMLSFGPFAGMLEEKYGCRTIAFIGSIFVSVGLATSSFVDSMFLLYLTYGIITGIGFSLCHVAANVVVNVYFDKKRVLAVGLSSAGSGIGTMVLPILGSYLMDIYNWQGTLLILSGVGLQGLYCAFMFGTLGTSTRQGEKEKGIPSISRNLENGKLEMDHNPASNVDSIFEKTKRILSSKKFIIFKISSVFVALGYFIPYVMLPDMVIERGIGKTNAALMITVSGIASILSRIIFGFISDFPFCNRLIVNGISLIILGIATSVCVLFYNQYLFFIYTSLLGLVTGKYCSLTKYNLFQVLHQTYQIL